MNMLNSIIIEGTVVENAETKTDCYGYKVATVEIENRHSYKKGDMTVEETDRIKCIGYGNVANIIGTVEKGRGIRAVGRFKQNKWTDSDGRKHSEIVVIIELVELKPMKIAG